MLDYRHMLEFSAELKPKFVIPPSFVIVTQFHCQSDFQKKPMKTMKAYDRKQKTMCLFLF